LFGPFVGWLIDRYGERRLAVAGPVCSGLAYSLFSTATDSTVYWVALWAFYATVNQMVMLTVWTSAVANVFTASRGLAISIAMIGTGLSAAIGPATANALIGGLGWRNAFIAMGLGFGSFVALISWFGIPHRIAGKAAAPPGAAMAGITLGQALRTSAYLKLILAIFTTYLLLQAMMVHLVPVLSSSGLLRDEAVAIAGLMGVGMVLGKIAAGLLLDRLDSRLVCAMALAVAALGILSLSIDDAPASIRMMSVLMFGLGTGGISPIYPYLTARLFGMASFGRLYGATTSIYALANSLGPIGASRVYDGAHSYQLILAAAPALLIVPVALIWSLRRLPEPR
jgi:MFS family permease